jgi:hypothetical protein
MRYLKNKIKLVNFYFSTNATKNLGGYFVKAKLIE